MFYMYYEPFHLFLHTGILCAAFLVIVFAHYSGKSRKSRDITVKVGCNQEARIVGVKEGYAVASRIRETTKEYRLWVYDTFIPESGTNTFQFTCKNCQRTEQIKVRSDGRTLLIKIILFLAGAILYLVGTIGLHYPDLGWLEAYRGFSFLSFVLAASTWYHALTLPFGGHIVGGRGALSDDIMSGHKLFELNRHQRPKH